MVTTIEQRAAQVGDAALKMKQPIARRPDAPAIVIPLLRMSAVESAFTLGIRLHIGELPILWNSAGQEFKPDLIVIESEGIHWVVEVKMDKEMESEDVKGKREAARRSANYGSSDEKVRVTWRYLLVSESDVDTAKGSWSAPARLGGEQVRPRVRRYGGRQHAAARRAQPASVGCVISAGITQASNSSPVRNPDATAAARRVEPSWWAVFAIFAALS